jgi:hypothetical protein
MPTGVTGVELPREGVEADEDVDVVGDNGTI